MRFNEQGFILFFYRKAVSIRLFVFLIVSVLISACATEQRIAYSFQQEIPKTIVLVQNSAEVYLDNSKIFISDISTDQERNVLLDSAYYSSDLIQYIDNKTFAEDFSASFYINLQLSKFIIYPPDSISSFIQEKVPRVLIDIVQIEIEEYLDEYYEELTDAQIAVNNNKYLHITEANFSSYYDYNGIERELYSVNIPRNSINVNLWLDVEIWDIDSVHTSNTVFMNYQMNDNIEGMFVWKNSENVNFIYTIDSIQKFDLWKVEKYSSKDFSRNVIDYIVNNVIEHRFINKEGKNSSRNWKYSMQTGRILPIESELPYIILEEE